MAEGGHHDLAAHGASGTPAASRKMAGWIFRHVHHLGVHERLRDGDVDVEGAEGEVVADGWHRPLAETTCVVEDQMLRAESLHQPRQHTLAGLEEVARPDELSNALLTNFAFMAIWNNILQTRVFVFSNENLEVKSLALF